MYTVVQVEMRRAVALRNSVCALSKLARPRRESFHWPLVCLSSPGQRCLQNAAQYTTPPYTLRSISVYPSATSIVLSQRHSVAYCRNLRTLNSVHVIRLLASSSRSSPKTSNTVRYIVATIIGVLGLSYAAVPLYRLYCQASGYGGTVTKTDAGEKVEKMEPDRERSIVIRRALSLFSLALCLSVVLFVNEGSMLTQVLA